jgi:ABC-type amino acid transport substrate-binding protein
MKKILSILGLALMLTLSLTACSQSVTPSPSAIEIKEIGPQEYFSLFNGKTFVTVSMRNSPEYNQKIIENFYHDVLKLDLKYKSLVYVDSLTDGLLMLRSHKADVLHTMRFTGSYLAKRSSDLKQYWPQLGVFSTQMIFSTQKQAQYERVNNELKAMKEDGTLDKLTAQWITNLPVGKEPSSGKMAPIKGVETIKMGISGDEPPLDYIAADGSPGGFNVAVLAALSQRININIELVTVSSGARFAALQSGKIDAFLWHNTLYSVDGLTEESISPEKTGDANYYYKTMSYLDDKESLLVLK